MAILKTVYMKAYMQVGKVEAAQAWLAEFIRLHDQKKYAQTHLCRSGTGG
jgi:hypothetical protein